MVAVVLFPAAVLTWAVGTIGMLGLPTALGFSPPFYHLDVAANLVLQPLGLIIPILVAARLSRWVLSDDTLPGARDVLQSMKAAVAKAKVRISPLTMCFVISGSTCIICLYPIAIIPASEARCRVLALLCSRARALLIFLSVVQHRFTAPISSVTTVG